MTITRTRPHPFRTSPAGLTVSTRAAVADRAVLAAARARAAAGHLRQLAAGPVDVPLHPAIVAVEHAASNLDHLHQFLRVPAHPNRHVIRLAILGLVVTTVTFGLHRHLTPAGIGLAVATGAATAALAAVVIDTRHRLRLYRIPTIPAYQPRTPCPPGSGGWIRDHVRATAIHLQAATDLAEDISLVLPTSTPPVDLLADEAHSRAIQIRLHLHTASTAVDSLVTQFER
nr:hypothetical protein [Micromonospora sp. DSM 115978]